MISHDRNGISRRLFQPVKRFLLMGLSPERISHTIALGACLGTMPVPGTSTLLCTFVSLVFRLNLPLIQFINYAVFPLQFFLLIPYYKGAAFLTGTQILGNFPNGFFQTFKENWFEAFISGIVLIAAAVFIWLLVSVPVYFAIQKITKPILERQSNVQ